MAVWPWLKEVQDRIKGFQEVLEVSGAVPLVFNKIPGILESLDILTQFLNGSWSP